GIRDFHVTGVQTCALPISWYQLGVVYSQEGDLPRAALATAERYAMTGQPQLAVANAETAMRGIPQGTPDYIRAEDIALTSRQAKIGRASCRDRGESGGRRG